MGPIVFLNSAYGTIHDMNEGPFSPFFSSPHPPVVSVNTIKDGEEVSEDGHSKHNGGLDELKGQIVSSIGRQK